MQCKPNEMLKWTLACVRGGNLAKKRSNHFVACTSLKCVLAWKHENQQLKVKVV